MEIHWHRDKLCASWSMVPGSCPPWSCELHRVNSDYRYNKCVDLKVLAYVYKLVVWQLFASLPDNISWRNSIIIGVTSLHVTARYIGSRTPCWAWLCSSKSVNQKDMVSLNLGVSLVYMRQQKKRKRNYYDIQNIITNNGS